MRISTSNKIFFINCFSILMIVTVLSVMFSGMKGLLSYRKSVQLDLPITFASLKLFSRDFLNRKYQQLFIADIPDENDILEFYLYTSKSDIELLDSDLPSSGKLQYISAQVKLGKNSRTVDADLRYRGGLPLHWLYDKKSFRIKLPAFSTIMGARKINLVNPSTINSIPDILSFEIAKDENILTPKFIQSRVYINDEYNGLHYYLEQADESFLRRNSRMPGSIYSGDTLFKIDSFGSGETAFSEMIYKGINGESLLWKDSRLWVKDSARNAESSHDRSDIKKYISIIGHQSEVDFYRDFNLFFDVEKYYSFWGVDTLVGAYHHDNFHNHKIYFDPYLGKFEPIEWDVRFWSGTYMHKDLPINPLLKHIILNPFLEFQRDKATYKLMKKYPTYEVINKIESIAPRIREELAADPYRQRPGVLYGRFKVNKTGPFSLEEFDGSIDGLKYHYELRQIFLNSIMDNAVGFYEMVRVNANSFYLNFSVTGNSPIKFVPKEILAKIVKSNYRISRVWEGKLNNISFLSEEIIYPGRMAKAGNALGRTDEWAVSAFGNEMFVSAPLNYQYLVEVDDSIDLTSVALDAYNAITDTKVEIHNVDKIPTSSTTDSLHPWELSFNSTKNKKSIVLSGNINIIDDKIFKKNTVVTILPGTVFNIAPSVSLFFYGKIIALGNDKEPIVFQRSKEGAAWGSIVIQGKGANGSILSHIITDGGTTTQRNLINYPGQFNIHGVDGFEVEYCTMSSNSIGDDMLHVAYSHGKISHCLFEDTNADAIDIDISSVDLKDIHFREIGNDAIDLMNSVVNIENIKVDQAGDKCLSIGEASNAKIYNSQLENCEIGIAVKDESVLLVDNIYLNGHRQMAISLYRKNPRYSFGGKIYGQNITGISKEEIEIGKFSVNKLIFNNAQ